MEWNSYQINAVWNFTYTSYEAHMQSFNFAWKWFWLILQETIGDLWKVKFDKMEG